MVSIRKEDILERQHWAAGLHYSQQSDLAASLCPGLVLSITRIKRYISDQSIEHLLARPAEPQISHGKVFLLPVPAAWSRFWLRSYGNSRRKKFMPSAAASGSAVISSSATRLISKVASPAVFCGK